MRTSMTGYNLIKKYEGYRNTSYLCPAGVWTIGYGHTKGVKPNMSCTQFQADCWLQEDCVEAEAQVNKYMSKYNFNQNQYDALVSFALNIGSITQLTAKGTRSIPQISEKIKEYNKAGGVKLQGLIARRKDETALFNTPCATSQPQAGQPSPEDVARMVIEGKLGNGAARTKAIKAMGYDPKAIQVIVNKIMK